MENFLENEVLILFGAGASVNAGIPHSTEMIRRLERYINNKASREIKDLYNYIKSAILFFEGKQGKFDGDVNYNIETIITALNELQKRDNHPLTPFVGDLDSRLEVLAGPDFKNIDDLKKIVLQLLRKWVADPDEKKAEYFERIVDFQQKLNWNLRLFTLNYDRCVERAWENRQKTFPERGFNDGRWDWKVFDGDNESPGLYLYKLHGSTDWFYDLSGDLRFENDTIKVDDDDVAIIFGGVYKLQYIDPFLFFAYEFRKWTLEAKVILCVGYGFGDDHINSILGQALNHPELKKLIAVGPLPRPRNQDDKNEKEKILRAEKDRICKSISLAESKHSSVVIEDAEAKDFFQEKLDTEWLIQFRAEQEEAF